MLKLSRPKRTILLIWAGWVVAMLVYQVMVPARLGIVTPDKALMWTAAETTPGSQDGKPYLNEPFLNSHVSWDSEYYLAIAVYGYEDPSIHRINAYVEYGPSGAGYWPFIIPTKSGEPILAGIPLSYAFFPFYPLVIRLVSVPLSLLGLPVIATASLAGVLVSVLGTLLGMISLYELASEELGEEGGLRAAFYLVIFPSGLFLAQVYTEGLFVGLAFSSLVLLRRGKRGWAALLAVFATYTRAVGVALVLPLLISWIRDQEWRDLDLEWRQIYFQGLPWRVIWNGLVAFSPILAYLLWKISYYGMAFGQVEAHFFGRGLLSLGSTFITWSNAFGDLLGENPQAAAYYALEWAAVILGFVACSLGFKKYPDLALFGFAVVFLSFTSGQAQGMHRYVIAAPPVFLQLSSWGKNRAFDRTWTIISILVMGMIATLFTFDMWAG
ncbi:mannosyltransferase family protein [Chloroflexota bacterium]